MLGARVARAPLGMDLEVTAGSVTLFHDLTSSASVSRSREAGARSSRSFPDKRVIARLLTGGAFVYAHVSRGCKVVSGL
jgi:hypothetical protein